jgi:sulfate transporter 1, high-affinity
VSISFAKILLQVTRPRTALLGNLPGTTIYRNTDQYPDARHVPGVVIVRVDSAIYFSNSNYIRERYKYKPTMCFMYSSSILINFHALHFRILRWSTDEEEKVKAEGLSKINFLIVEMSRK